MLIRHVLYGPIVDGHFYSRVFPSLSLSAAEPPLPTAPPLHCTPPPIRRTAHPISHLLCWFFAARETFPNTNRAYGVYRLFTRHNARLSPLFRCITGFNYTKQGPERSHHGLWTRLGDIDMRYQGLLYGRTESVANPTPVFRISHAFDKVFLLASTKLNNSLAELSKQVMRIVNFIYCNHNSKVYSYVFKEIAYISWMWGNSLVTNPTILLKEKAKHEYIL